MPRRAMAERERAAGENDAQHRAEDEALQVREEDKKETPLLSMLGMSQEAFNAMSMADLHALSEAARRRVYYAKFETETFASFLRNRFSHETQQKLGNQQGGTVNIVEDGFEVKATYEKVVEWDDAALAALADEMRQEGDNPEDFMVVETTYKVPAAKYDGFDTATREVFDGLRKVTTKAPKMTISKKDKD